MVAWGDSLTHGASATAFSRSYWADFAALINRPVLDEGVPGDTSTQILTRFQAAPGLASRPTLIWAGRNDFNSPATVKANIASMVAALGHTNYLVLGIINQNVTSEWAGGADYATIVQLNADLATIYGAHFVDVRSYLVSLWNPSIPQDVIDRGHDIPPSSLRPAGEALHLNDAGYQAVANFVYANRSQLGLN